MDHSLSVLALLQQAGPLVKSVLFVLLTLSVLSWTFILQRAWYYRRLRQQLAQFDEAFWSGVELNQLYTQLEQGAARRDGLAPLFKTGFQEFLRLKSRLAHDPDGVLAAVKRAMRVAMVAEIERLEKHLGFLATVGSISPYIGLFGTVWGIMAAFQALGHVQQATISMVAPGISEALIATAMGLFAAIPAVVAYNRYSATVEHFLNQYDAFQEEFINILVRLLNHTT